MDSVFSGEEAYGKHLDLYLSHTQYLNLKGSSRLSYFGYLDMLRQGKVERTLDLKEKSLPAYLEYVQTLYSYLVSFFDRSLPLVDIHSKIRQEEERFEAAWAAGQVDGWEIDSGKKTAPSGEGIWCPYCELLVSVLERIWLRPAGQKNYSKQTVYDAHLNSDKHKKKEKAGIAVSDPSKANGSSAPVASSSSSRDRYHPPARLTFLVHSLLTTEPIPARLQASRDEVQRRMALTSREREEELEQQEEQAPPAETAAEGEDEDEDEDGKIYNPLKLPLGWDGKPIPFWLYKLHGLGVTFECELCSENYRGRKVSRLWLIPSIVGVTADCPRRSTGISRKLDIRSQCVLSVYPTPNISTGSPKSRMPYHWPRSLSRKVGPRWPRPAKQSRRRTRRATSTRKTCTFN